MKEILQKLKTDFELRTGAKFTGIIAALAAAFASRLAEFQDKLNWIVKQAFVSTADTEYLYLHGAHLVEPRGADVATGYVIFFGAAGGIVPAGTEIKDDKGTYTTAAEAEIKPYEFQGTATIVDDVVTLPANLELPSCTCQANGYQVNAISTAQGFWFLSDSIVQGQTVTIRVQKSDPIKCSSTEAGESGNRDFDSQLKTKTTIDSVNKEARVLGITGGREAEGVEEYRAQLKNFLSKPQAPFSRYNIEQTILNGVSTIQYVWIKGGEFYSDRVEIFMLNRSGGLLADEILKAKGLIPEILPAQIGIESIAFAKPEIKQTTVNIKGITPDTDLLRAEIVKTVESIFRGDTYERDISGDEITAIIYAAETSSGEKAQNFQLVSGAQSAEFNTFWTLSSVEFTK